MLAEQRREKILELIRENGSARVKDLSILFGVSEPTIRQDLDKVENAGEIARDHGGAFLKNIQLAVSSLSLEHRENMDLKQRIGNKAAEFVRSGSTIIMDSGTTVTELAKVLKGKKDLRIITNSLNIALIIGAEPGMEVHMTGGEFKAPTLSLTGEKAAAYFSNTHTQQLFLATAGVSLSSGLTYPGFSDIPVKKAMIESAEEVFLLADSTKINKTAFAALHALDRIDYLITDNRISSEDIQSFTSFGIKVIIA
ncbi:DeoR/GlpR family DNA-binding transcription regulator [Oceanispirochaeta sp.]|uniref:DeoR/GlpR family DNA-binding transcription regulator n=1 Tax=Oceanispirochaeta sp. TaxID=2035350 RepID=UPI002608CE67|nr:DeoR/GlpR family DNA-binding transcription regulator [Oceanispirochaeta sp.]MDA3958031.1 DeoR/GlpR family DNA-binding transcription regulator [Oceanispirochaeta sp.]